MHLSPKLYKLIVRPVLFLLPPETAHYISLYFLNVLAKLFPSKIIEKEKVAISNLNFKNKVCLAAGLDKNAEFLDGLAMLGFGAIEVGTVTPRPQNGNQRPRLFRIESQSSVLNRMGFNNCGVKQLLKNIRSSRYKGILGINIGKNADTPVSNAADDYLYCLEKVYKYASYVTVNISSPNTKNLRQLQERKYFSNLVSSFMFRKKNLDEEHRRIMPVFIKISPDESFVVLKNIVDVAIENNVTGLIVSNTSSNPEYKYLVKKRTEPGGLSGKVIENLSKQALATTIDLAKDRLVIIASGAIFTKEDYQNRISMGANLVQIYSGLIYEGPGIVGSLLK